MTWALLLVANSSASSALRVDPARPPTAIAEADHRTLVLAFPDGPIVRTRNAAVISLREGASPPARLVAEGRPLGAAARHWVVEGTAREDGLQIALRWLADPAVADAIPDLLREKAPAFDDPSFGGQWYLEQLEMGPLFEETLGDPAVRIAVIDGAIDITHPDLAEAVVDPYDAVDVDDDPSPIAGDECPTGVVELCDGHGTAVAGITVARADNGSGIVGLCPGCSLVPIRLLGNSAPLSAEVDSFEHAIEADAWVINNSWGYIDAIPAPTALAEVVSRAVTEGRGGLGAVVVWAAGNDDRKVTKEETVGLPGVLCVSAVDSYHLPTNYTNYGPPVDLSAPSATVTLAPGGGVTETFGGTSAAAPVVAGFAGWLLSVDPSLTAEEVGAVLMETAHKSSLVTFDDAGHDDVYGFGELDPPAVLARLRGPEGSDLGAEPTGCGCSTSDPSAASFAALFGLLWLRRKA